MPPPEIARFELLMCAADERATKIKLQDLDMQSMFRMMLGEGRGGNIKKMISVKFNHIKLRISQCNYALI